MINIAVEVPTRKNIGEHVIAPFSDKTVPEPAGAPISPAYAGGEDDLLGQSPFQTAVQASPPIAESETVNLASAASGNEPLQVPEKVNVLDGD